MHPAFRLIRNHPREFWPVLWVVPAFAGVFTFVWIIAP